MPANLSPIALSDLFGQFSKHDLPGLLITLEGLDGAGKTTQARLLAKKLRYIKQSHIEVKEPTNGPWGQKIRALDSRNDISPAECLELFLKDRAQDVTESILPALREGLTVVADRYILSNAAYQGAMGLDPRHVILANQAFPYPDLMIILDIAPEEGLARIERNRQGGQDKVFEEKAFLAKVSMIFQSFFHPRLFRIDASLPEADISNQISHLALKAIKAKQSETIPGA
jgi:dTMP kinase